MKLITDREVRDVRAYLVANGEDPIVVDHIPAVTLLYHLRDGKTSEQIRQICLGITNPLEAARACDH